MYIIITLILLYLFFTRVSPKLLCEMFEHVYIEKNINMNSLKYESTRKDYCIRCGEKHENKH